MSLFASRWVEPPKGTEELEPQQLAPGFRAAGVACGIKRAAADLGLLACDTGEVASALLLTANAAAAAPVRVCRERVEAGAVRAAVVNSGNANAATGPEGYRAALAMQDSAANALGFEPERVAVAETGVIGEPLPIGAVRAGIEDAAEGLGTAGGLGFARAIMTSDSAPKALSVRCGGVTLSAQAKGAGMIQPRFATMLCFIQTDAELANPESELRRAVAGSFERITVDGQTSTNDTVLLQATGGAGRPLPEGLLDAVLLELALRIVGDGEGATRVARIRVSEAASSEEAERVARAVANSPLVKTALYGRDPNWGRVAQAAGMALAGEGEVELGLERVAAEELGLDLAQPEIAVRLGRGDATGHAYFSDLTPDYVRLNSEYTT